MTADVDRGIFALSLKHIMITVALADPNITYCQGLRTILEQMDGIKVITVSPGFLNSETAEALEADILFIDEDLYLEFGSPGGKKDKLFPSVCTVILTLDSETQIHCPEHNIHKKSGKKDFEMMIRKLVPGRPEQTLSPS